MTTQEMQTDHEKWMRLALEEAKKAFDEGEVPVGAVLVRDTDNTLLAVGRNRREVLRHALAHAEMEALDGGCKTLGGWRLPHCTLYVTLEPCPMCAGAIHNARIDRVVFGAADQNNGACGSKFSMNEVYYNHKTQVIGGVLEAECSALMNAFFEKLRARRKKT